MLAVVFLWAQAPVDLATARLIDLTHPFDGQTLYWPTSPSAFELTTLSAGPTPGGYFYSSYKLCTPEHGGTHLDAPVHFSQAGRSTAELPLRQLMAPAVVIDVTRQAAADAAYRVTRADVEAFEAAHGGLRRARSCWYAPAGAASGPTGSGTSATTRPVTCRSCDFPGMERMRPGCW